MGLAPKKRRSSAVLSLIGDWKLADLGLYCEKLGQICSIEQCCCRSLVACGQRLRAARITNARDAIKKNHWRQAQVRPMIETMPLERAAEAYDRMMSGKAQFRMVLVTGR
jgi:hypothetical protein